MTIKAERRELNKNMETRMAIIETKLEQNEKDHQELKGGLQSVECKVDKVVEKLDGAIESKADKQEFLFWRNSLVIGLVVSIFLMLIGIYAGK